MSALTTARRARAVLQQCRWVPARPCTRFGCRAGPALRATGTARPAPPDWQRAQPAPQYDAGSAFLMSEDG